MNDLMSTTKPANGTLMTSKEIATLTGKTHQHVCRDIRAMMDAIKDGPDMDHKQIQGVTEELDQRGYVAIYSLDKEMTFTLLTGYRADLRQKVVQRWMALEEAERGRKEAGKKVDALKERAVQVENSKKVNAMMLAMGGRDACRDYNAKSCLLQSGKFPHEILAEAKEAGLPSKYRGSAKEVLRHTQPEVACAMTLTDDMVVKGVSMEDAVAIGKESQKVFKMMIAAGRKPAELFD